MGTRYIELKIIASDGPPDESIVPSEIGQLYVDLLSGDLYQAQSDKTWSPFQAAGGGGGGELPEGVTEVAKLRTKVAPWGGSTSATPPLIVWL